MIRKHIMLLLCALSVAHIASGHESQIGIVNINTRNGLSHNTVRSICFDRQGFLWAGTIDGLCRYDGHGFSVYKSRVGDPSTLSDGRIRSVESDDNGFVWLKKYDNTVSCYSPIFEKIVAPVDSIGNVVETDYKNFFIDDNGDTFLYGGRIGVMKISTDTGKPVVVWKSEVHTICDMCMSDIDESVFMAGDVVLNLTPDGKETLTKTNDGRTIKSICSVGSKLFAVNTSNNIQVLDTRYPNERLRSINTQFGKSYVDIRKASDDVVVVISPSQRAIGINVESENVISPYDLGSDQMKNKAAFVTDNKNGLWMKDHSGLIYRYDKRVGRLIPIRIMTEEEAERVDSERFEVLIDSRGGCWITTYGSGVFRVDLETNQVTDNIRYDGSDNGLPSDYLLAITEDKYGDIWLGSEYAGIIELTQRKRPTQTRLIQPEEQTSRGISNNIRCIHETPDGNVWIGTRSGTLYIYDKGLKTLLYKEENINPYAVCVDKKNRVWVGTKGNGVYLYDIKTFKKTDHFVHDSKALMSICSNEVFDIHCDQVGNIWIASYKGGLDLVKEYKGPDTPFEHFFNHDALEKYIRKIYEDRNGKIWLGSNNGLTSFYPYEIIVDHKKYSLYSFNANDKDGLGSRDVIDICEDMEGNIWVATNGGGLNKMVTDGNEVKFKKITTDDGMPSDVIESIVCSNDSILWVGTMNGLVKYNTAQNTFRVTQNQNSLNGTYFCENCAIQHSNSQLLMGTIEGLVAFYPQELDLPVKTTSNKPTFTALFTDRKVTNIGEKKSPLKTSISLIDNLALDNDQNTFAVSFSSLDFAHPGQSYYTYMLEGLHDEWSTPAPTNAAFFRGVPSGKYTLRVKEMNSDEEARLKITINPPPTRSTMAFSIYVLVAVIIAILIVQYVMRVRRLRQALSMERQLADYKLRFFVNISHELRTPLTMLKGTTDSMEEEADQMTESMKSNFDMLKQNIERLSQLVLQILEYKDFKDSGPRPHFEDSSKAVTAQSEKDAKKKTVLVVDDSSEICQLLATRLKLDYNILVAHNGKEALNIIESETVNLVLSDVVMPVMDGIELTKRIKTEPRYEGLPIILLTAHPSDALQVEGNEVGADDYIMKPFNFKQLLARIDLLIEKKKIR